MPPSIFENAAVPSAAPETNVEGGSYSELTGEFHQDLLKQLQETEGEIIQRNEEIADRDEYVYGDKIQQMLDIPVGHDITPVNWLKRIVEIHKTQFMGRPFHMISTFDSTNIDTAQDDQDKQRLEIENKRKKTIAELRKQTIDAIIADNGGHAMFMEGAESASVAGCWVVKTFYDEDEKKFVISPVEAVENCYVAWSKDNFRQHDIFAYAYQVSKMKAIAEFGVKDTVATSPLGFPLDVIGVNVPINKMETEPMVTILEATGKVPGWCSKNGRISKCTKGDETVMNVVFIGGELKRVIDDPKKVPKYYIFPNKKERRRAWGKSDITDAAINILLTYIETLSDWRTVANKVNFPKFKGFNFGPDVQFPKFKSRSIQVLPLAEGQDIQQLGTGDAGAVDFKAQIQELKEQFVRETGVAQVLLDNSGMPLNSNQALITSMKPTSDIAESKKELWSPVLVQMFTDAFETLAAYEPQTYGDINDDTEPWSLKVQWPSTIQKEDPIYQQMLLNRWNSRTISLQSFLEAQGESNEEVERLRDEMSDMMLAAIHANMLQTTFSLNFLPPPATAPPKVSYNLRGDLDPGQVGNITYAHGGNGGPNDPNAPFPTSAGPVGNPGRTANDNAENAGLISGKPPQPTSTPQVAPQTNNTPGTQPVSQPGSGAPQVTPQGAINQTNQNQGR
jgi:hypothetical protein